MTKKKSIEKNEWKIKSADPCIDPKEVAKSAHEHGICCLFFDMVSKLPKCFVESIHLEVCADGRGVAGYNESLIINDWWKSVIEEYQKQSMDKKDKETKVFIENNKKYIPEIAEFIRLLNDKKAKRGTVTAFYYKKIDNKEVEHVPEQQDIDAMVSFVNAELATQNKNDIENKFEENFGGEKGEC